MIEVITAKKICDDLDDDYISSDTRYVLFDDLKRAIVKLKRLSCKGYYYNKKSRVYVSDDDMLRLKDFEGLMK